jgi:sterol desaturase/sphingolipid hydroxylase (fatty acid hydroxylase superfamily)
LNVPNLLQQEAAVRLAVFAGTLALVVLAEQLWPRRPASVPRSSRWFDNLSLVVANTLVVRFCLPLLPVGAALAAHARQLGILNRVEWPSGMEVALSILALDLTIYFQHRLVHAVHLLWRAHRVHHSDLDFDASTGLRFHPLEIALSLLIKMGTVFLLGAPAVAVVLFEVLLNATSIFNHANLRLPPRVDIWLRRFMVTPDMHRVHHSPQLAETNKNFGFNFPWWDRLFGTYRDQPAAGHDAMQIGLGEFRDPPDQTLWGLLLQPLRRTSSGA